MSYVLGGLNSVVQLAFVGLLLFLSFRMRSKGLMFMSVVLLCHRIFEWIYSRFLFPNMYDRWDTDKVIEWLGLNMGRVEFILTISHISSLLFYSLYFLGVFLIYKEWRQGKFRHPSPEHVEEPRA